LGDTTDPLWTVTTPGNYVYLVIDGDRQTIDMTGATVAVEARHIIQAVGSTPSSWMRTIGMGSVQREGVLIRGGTWTWTPVDGAALVEEDEGRNNAEWLSGPLYRARIEGCVIDGYPNVATLTGSELASNGYDRRAHTVIEDVW